MSNTSNTAAVPIPTSYIPTPAAQAVIDEYDALQSRAKHPAGSFDSAGRWYPDDSLDCCASIRDPSRAYPYSYMVHCRTLPHVLNSLRANEETRREVRSLLMWRRGKLAEARRETLAVPVAGYKSCAVGADGCLRSIYDGSTLYQIGGRLTQQARSNHGGGYYVYDTPAEAARAELPLRSRLLDAPRVIVRCECSGRRVRYNSGKIAYTHVQPLEVVACVLPDIRDAVSAAA